MPSTHAASRARRLAPPLALLLALAAPGPLRGQTMEVELTPMSAAASRGDTAAVRALLDAGTDADARDDLGWTALTWAAISGRLHVARLLLARDASCVCTRDPEGKTALIHAAIHGSTEVARLLLEAGADLQAADAHGFTALDHAETNGRDSVAALLRRHAASLPRSGAATPADSAAAPGRP